MKTIALIFFVAACVVELTLSASTSDDSSEDIYDTPLGPMNYDELIKNFKRYRYHKYDSGKEYVIDFIKDAQNKLEELIAKPGNRRSDVTLYNNVKVNLEDFLKDIENDVLIKECSLETIADYHTKLFRNVAESSRTDDIKELAKYVRDQFRNTPEGQIDRTIYQFILDNDLDTEIRKDPKFDTVCCKFWDKSHHNLIRGEC